MTKQTRPFYHDFAWAYDLIIKAPAKERCDFVQRVLGRHSKNKSLRILDAGCGTGSYTIELATRGYHLTGIDSSRAQLNQAELKLQNCGMEVNFEQLDLLSYNSPHKFDLIFCRGVLNDLIEDSDRLRIFETFASVLDTSGLLLFDVRDWEGSVIQKTADPVSEKHLQTEHGELHFRSETRLNHESRLMEITESHELKTSLGTKQYSWDLVMRPWTEGEIDEVITLAGFEILEQFGDFDENVAIGSTERRIVVAQKKLA